MPKAFGLTLWRTARPPVNAHGHPCRVSFPITLQQHRPPSKKKKRWQKHVERGAAPQVEARLRGQPSCEAVGCAVDLLTRAKPCPGQDDGKDCRNNRFETRVRCRPKGPGNFRGANRHAEPRAGFPPVSAAQPPRFCGVAQTGCPNFSTCALRNLIPRRFLDAHFSTFGPRGFLESARKVIPNELGLSPSRARCNFSC